MRAGCLVSVCVWQLHGWRCVGVAPIRWTGPGIYAAGPTGPTDGRSGEWRAGFDLRKWGIFDECFVDFQRFCPNKGNALFLNYTAKFGRTTQRSSQQFSPTGSWNYTAKFKETTRQSSEGKMVDSG